jgi:uncharacterized OB-fold protein
MAVPAGSQRLTHLQQAAQAARGLCCTRTRADGRPAPGDHEPTAKRMNKASEAAAATQPTRLAPIVAPDAKFFWDAADRGELVGQRCGQCGVFRFPPRPMCPHCHSLERQVVPLSGRGRVYSWIRPVHPKPFGFSEPPIVALIELAEGFRLVSNLVGIAFQDVRADLPVAVEFAATQGGHRVPVFRPVPAP